MRSSAAQSEIAKLAYQWYSTIRLKSLTRIKDAAEKQACRDEEKVRYEQAKRSWLMNARAPVTAPACREMLRP